MMMFALLGTVGTMGAGLLVTNWATGLTDENNSLKSRVASQSSTIQTLRNTIIAYNAANPNQAQVPLPVISFSVAPEETVETSNPSVSQTPTLSSPNPPISLGEESASSSLTGQSQPELSALLDLLEGADSQNNEEELGGLFGLLEQVNK